MTRASAAAAIGLPSPIPALIDPLPRRGFLRGLAKLPLIGGSVALLGQPTAVAEPVTFLMLEAYKTWLEYERRWLSWEMAADPVHQARYRNFVGDRVALSKAIDGHLAFVGDSGNYHTGQPAPSTRAALVLSTVGCSWEDKHGTYAYLSAPSGEA